MARKSLGIVLALACATHVRAQPHSSATAAQLPAASDAGWQFTGALLIFAGLVYDPTHEMRFFDPRTLTRVGVYRGVAVYLDVLQQPYSVAYVPIGRGLVRAYRLADRRRTPDSLEAPMERPEQAAVRTAGTSGGLQAVTSAPPAAPVPTHVESIPPPAGNRGVWVDYRGRRWFSAGAAVVFSPGRFARIGEYRGFAVYRDARQNAPDEIWVDVVRDGPVAPYTTR